MMLLKINTTGTTGTTIGQIGQIGRMIGQTGRRKNFHSALLMTLLNGYLRLAQVSRTLKLRGLVTATTKTTTSKTVIASPLAW